MNKSETEERASTSKDTQKRKEIPGQDTDLVIIHPVNQTHMKLIIKINRLISNLKYGFNQADYDQFKDIISCESLINESHLIQYLVFKLNNLIAINIEDYFHEEKDVRYEISALKTLIKNEKIDPEKAISLLVKFLSIKTTDTETNLNMIATIKSILIKKNTIKDLESNLKEKFTARVDNFLLEFSKVIFKPDLDPTSLKNTQMYLINKFIKCVLLYIDKEIIPTNDKFCSEMLFYLIETNFIQNENRFKGNFNVYVTLIEFFIKLVFSFDRSSEMFASDEKINSLLKILNIDAIFSYLDDDKIIKFTEMCLEKEIRLKKVSFHSDLFDFTLNSHVLFVKLMVSISFDYEIVIDWLVENQTRFLDYFVKYLKNLLNELDESKMKNINKIFSNDNDDRFRKFARSLINSNLNISTSSKTYLIKTFNFLKEVTIKIKKLKNHFGYNINPLIKLLDKIIQFN